MIIRRLRWAEHNDLLYFAKRIHMESEYRNHWYSSPKDYDSGHVIGAFDVGEMIGACLISHGKKRPTTKINFIDVLPEHQGRGIGREMVEYVRKSSPWGVVELKCRLDNSGGQAFWEKLGFVRGDEVDGHCMWIGGGDGS